MHRKELDNFIESYCKSSYFSGSLRITLHDKIIYEKHIGFSNIYDKTPLTNNSIYSLYSLSKPFCAIGLLKLMDKGDVDIDKHPGEYVPEASAFDEALTIRHLLHHISGLPDFIQNEGFKTRFSPGLKSKIREHLTALSSYPMVFKPGTQAKYSNINFTICALIIENVSKMHYSDYMKNEVFDSLGMKNAIIDEENLTLPNRVSGHEIKDDKIIPVNRSLDWMLGGGDILATVDDVYCLNRAIKNKLLLKPETWNEALTPSPLNDKGMGCTISEWHGKKRITHNGGHIGFRTLHIQLPEDDFDIILLSNCGWGNAREDFAETIHRIYFGDNSLPSDLIEMDKGYI